MMENNKERWRAIKNVVERWRASSVCSSFSLVWRAAEGVSSFCSCFHLLNIPDVPDSPAFRPRPQNQRDKNLPQSARISAGSDGEKQTKKGSRACLFWRLFVRIWSRFRAAAELRDTAANPELFIPACSSGGGMAVMEGSAGRAAPALLTPQWSPAPWWWTY